MKAQKIPQRKRKKVFLFHFILDEGNEVLEQCLSTNYFSHPSPVPPTRYGTIHKPWILFLYPLEQAGSVIPHLRPPGRVWGRGKSPGRKSFCGKYYPFSSTNFICFELDFLHLFFYFHFYDKIIAIWTEYYRLFMSRNKSGWGFVSATLNLQCPPIKSNKICWWEM